MKIAILGHLNDPLIKKKVIKDTFPMKVECRIIKDTKPKVKINKKIKQKEVKMPDVKFNLQIKQPELVTYQIKPTPSTKNDKVHLLLDFLSDSFQELAHMTNQFKIESDGITLPIQNKLFFETKITNKEYSNYVTFPKSIEEETLQTMNFTWHKASKIKASNPVPKLIQSTVCFDLKLKHSPGLSLSIDQRLKEKPIRELIEQSQSIKVNEEVFIQFGIQPAEFDWWKEAKKRNDSLPKRKHISESSTSKLGNPAFDSCLRVIVNGENIRRSEMISRGIILALKQLNGDNELIEIQVKNKKLNKWYKKYVEKRKIDTHLFNFNKRFLLTRKEIRHFIKLPERNIQKDFNLGIDERQELNVNKLLTKKDGILIGHTEDKGKEVEIKIPYENDDSFFNTSIYFGSPRNGKDVTLTNTIIESCLKANCGAIVPDVIDEPIRGMADMLSNYLPEERVVDINLCDINHYIYLGLDDVINEIGVDLLANDIVKILELEDKFDSKQLCKLAAKATKCNLYDMYCFLSSDIYAKNIYEEIKVENELLALELENMYFDDKFKSNGKNQAKKAILTRLDDFISIDKVKYMFAQKPNNKFNLVKLMSENKVVIIRMQKTGGLGELACKTIMHLLLLKVFWLKKIMLNKRIPSRTFICLNEFHQFITKGLEELLTDMMFEAPKYKLGIMMSLHNPSKISSTLWSMMQSASATIYLFKNTNSKIYSDLEQVLRQITVEMAMKTQRFESILIPFVEGKQIDPLFVKMLMPPMDRLEKVNRKRNDQLIYGKDVENIRRYIYGREINMYKKSS